MAFDPDAYLAAPSPSASGGFDPDAYLAGTPQGDNQRWDQKASDVVTKGMNFLNNPGPGAYQGPVNTMQSNGDALFNSLGEKATEYLGRKNIPGNPYTAAGVGTAISMANPVNWMMNPKAIPDQVQLPGTSIAEGRAQSAAHRALGYTKGMLKKPGTLERANQVAQTMLDQGVIKNPLTNPRSFGAEDMYGRASDLADTSGKAIGKTISDLSGKPSIDTNAIGVEVGNQLAPKYSGGIYDTQKNITNEILDTIGAHGNGPIDFSSAQALKQKLGEIAQFSKSSDALKANMYQRAYGIVNDALEKAIGGATEGTDAAGQYIKNKQIYGASKEAEKALLNRMSSEAGNKRIGLTDTIAAGSELAAGNPMHAGVLLGLKHLAENAGNSLEARVMDYLAKSGTLGTAGIRGGIADLVAGYTQSRKSGPKR